MVNSTSSPVANKVLNNIVRPNKVGLFPQILIKYRLI